MELDQVLVRQWNLQVDRIMVVLGEEPAEGQV
jgi:hypothetical protein